MMLDIAALQRIYGANFAFNSGDSVYSWNSSTGEMSINGVGQGAPGGGGNGGTSNRVFLTIWDGGGNDTYDMSNYGDPVTDRSEAGRMVDDLGGAQIANLGDNNSARGNVANALLYQGNAASLIENAVGGSGSDMLIANQVANRLTGGATGDTFTWAYASSAGAGAAPTRSLISCAAPTGST